MRTRIQAVLVAAIVLVLTGIVLPMIWKVREAAARSQCRNNLMGLAMALPIYQDTYGTYPRGTAAGTSLPPERRLSFYVDLMPFVEGGRKWLLDPQKPWDDSANAPTRALCKTSTPDGKMGYEERVMGGVKFFLCPASAEQASVGPVSLTHYIVVAGVGADAATWPLEHPGVGLFGYDRSARPGDVKDGKSTTLALVETTGANGPWTAGGPATVRGLDPNGGPYLGRDGQFTASHHGLNVAFLDGTVRCLAPGIDPRVLEALATIAGGETLGPSDY